MAELVVSQAVLEHVRERVIGKPLAITAAKLDAILAFLGPRIGLEMPVSAEVAAPVQGLRPQYEVRRGVGVIPIMGTIVKRNGGGMLNSSGAVATEALTQVFRTAMTDPAVGAILLQIDSNGGEVSGTEEFAALVRSARGEKVVWAIADEHAYSAAYWIGSAAERVLITANGGAGSIGVIAVHVDQSEAIAARGFKPTTIKAGARKDAFSPLAPLSDEARAILQAEVDRVFERFVGAVASHRNLKADTVREFEADTFQGADAVRVGLADAVGTFDDTFTELATKPLGGRAPERSKKRMADGDNVVSIEDHKKGLTEATEAGRKAERERRAAITEMATLAAHGADEAMQAKVREVADACIDEGLTVEAARTKLVNELAKGGGEEIRTQHASGRSEAGTDTKAPIIDRCRQIAAEDRARLERRV